MTATVDKAKPLQDFFTAIRRDARVSVTHIGIYAALLQFRLENGFANPVEAYGWEIMQIAKVSAPYTYHKCVRALSEYGYINYVPSFNRNQRSKIYFPDKA